MCVCVCVCKSTGKTHSIRKVIIIKMNLYLTILKNYNISHKYFPIIIPSLISKMRLADISSLREILSI